VPPASATSAGPVALEVGRRTYLRHPRAGDRTAFLEAVGRSGDLHHPWVEAPSTPEAFATYLRRSRAATVSAHLLFRRVDDAVLGVLNLGEIVHGAFQSAYLGYYGFEPHTGRGYMTEGMKLVLRRAFVTLGLHRVEANIQPGNEPSRRLAERCGFRLEGYSPRYLMVGGQWRDHERWAITVEDWSGRRR
jgi:ribosomal-protein-alanine N-acetyltransferase